MQHFEAMVESSNFQKSGFVTFIHLKQTNLLQKKLRNPMAGSMRTFDDRQTDRQEDGSKFKGPKCWSKKLMAGSRRTFVANLKDQSVDPKIGRDRVVCIPKT